MGCYLKCTKGKYPDIHLKNGVTKTLGRSEETKIKTSRCSRKQIEVTANYATKTVKVRQIGPNNSGINKSLIGMGLEETAGHGDKVNILWGEIDYEVVFSSGDGDVEMADEGKERPPKIPKMFMSSKGNEFKKDELLLKGSWEMKDGKQLFVYVVGESILESKPYVASFDMDGTLITTKSGKVFPKDKNDWKFLLPQTVSKLQSFFESNPDFKFVLFTNQAGCKADDQLKEMKSKIETIVRQIGIPVLVFVAPGRNKYRKPLTGGWEVFVKDYNGGVQPDLVKSFYCGDAAGRKKDHAKSDRLFALNVGITFKTPEEFFQNLSKAQEYEMPLFDPIKYMANPPNNDHVTFSHRQEMIIMVGYPGSGKSSYVKSVILPKGFTHVNRDTLKTQAKCLSVAENALKNGENVVVDNTNPEKKDRLEYIKLAQKHKIPFRCFKMTVDHAHALHNNKFRELTSDTHASVPAVAFNAFKSRYQEPVTDEGYSEIVQVHFVPNFDHCAEPDRPKRIKLYSQYLSEK